jgi:hypothetical protein
MAAAAEVLPQDAGQTGAGETRQSQRAEAGNGCATGHGAGHLRIRYVSVRQCRRQSRAGRSQEEFMFGRQGYHEEGIS